MKRVEPSAAKLPALVPVGALATPMTTSAAAGPLRFGRFELQPRERRLLVHGQPVSLGARAFDVLLALAERPGRLVTKRDLMDLVWPGLVVQENNLAAQV